MNWDAIGATGEIIGALAVVVTILYLATQIRENTKQTEIQTKALNNNGLASATAGFSRFRALLVTDAAIAELWETASTQYPSLEGTDKLRAEKLFEEYFANCQLVYINWLAVDVAGEELRSRMDEMMSRELARKGVRNWWSVYSAGINAFGFAKDISILVNLYEEQDCQALK